MPKKRNRSKTPEIQWEVVPDKPPELPPAVSDAAARKEKQVRAVEKEKAAHAEAGSKPDRGGGSNGAAAGAAPADPSAERDGWRRVVVHLARLRGDPKLQRWLAKKHPELVGVAESCGAGRKKSMTLQQAREAAREWFERGLRGSNRHGPAERAALCNRLVAELQEFAAAWRSIEPDQVAEALREGRLEEEGPLVCALLGRELEGSSYEGIWISWEGPGVFCLGDDHEGAQDLAGGIQVAVRSIGGKLMIAGYFEDGALQSAKAAVGPFLSVYFDGCSLREATDRWDRKGPAAAAQPAAASGGSARAAGSSREEQELASRRALAAQLPPGWELRESRSKKGVFYYANPAKGLSQLERPKA